MRVWLVKYGERVWLVKYGELSKHRVSLNWLWLGFETWRGIAICSNIFSNKLQNNLRQSKIYNLWLLQPMMFVSLSVAARGVWKFYLSQDSNFDLFGRESTIIQMCYKQRLKVGHCRRQLVHCCTLSLCYLGAEMINKEIQIQKRHQRCR